MRCVVIDCHSDSEREFALAEAMAAAELAGVDESSEGVLRLWLAEETDAPAVMDRLQRWHPRLEEADDSTNYNEAWQQHWQPMEVGRRFFLVPPADAATPTPGGRIRLALHAGNAFGNGDHPTTHLCLMAMEEDLAPEAVFLDVGCGSGLLGEAALALGARQAFGCDLAPRLGSFTGSVNAVRTASCDYVAANIQLGVLLDLLGEIRRVMRQSAHGVLSGVLPEQAEALAAGVEAAGLSVVERMESRGWAALRVRPTASATASSAGRTARSDP